MSNFSDHLAASRARLALSDPWNGARSRQVFDGAVRSRLARARRHRFIAIACTASAAVFVLAIRSFGANAAFATTHAFEQNESANLTTSGSFAGSGDPLGISGGVGSGAISMNADLFADGGREAD